MTKNNITIVIVEDDPLLMRLYQEAFGDRGYTVVPFFNGEEAYDGLHKMTEKPILILSDVMMPKMNGLELLEKLRGSAELKTIPFVLSTNLDQMQYADEGLSLGAIAYLVKGQYTMKEIIDKIEEFIVARRREPEVPETKVPIRDIAS